MSVWVLIIVALGGSGSSEGRAISVGPEFSSRRMCEEAASLSNAQRAVKSFNDFPLVVAWCVVR